MQSSRGLVSEAHETTADNWFVCDRVRQARDSNAEMASRKGWRLATTANLLLSNTPVESGSRGPKQYLVNVPRQEAF